MNFQDFLSWLVDHHSEESVIIQKTLDVHGLDLLSEDMPATIDYESIQQILPKQHWENFQDLWTEFCMQYPMK